MADAFELRELVARLALDRHDFAEFFRTRTLSLTIARWPVGSIDAQRPHGEDEVYYVAAGRGRLRIGGEVLAVGPGSVVFVASGTEHRFEDIAEDLEVLVFWSPPRRSRSGEFRG